MDMQADIRSGQRILGIDSMRCPLLFMLVFMHGPQIGRIGAAGNLLGRATVPFFFIAAGFFLSRINGITWDRILVSAQRILLPFCAWVAFYLALDPDIRMWEGPSQILDVIVNGGPAYHLWFLPSLFVDSIFLLAIKDRLPHSKLIVVALLLYGAALLLGNYAELVSKGTFPALNTRDGPFLGLPLMIAGFLIAKYRPAPSTSLLLGVALLAFVSELVEFKFLRTNGLDNPNRGVMIGTVPFGVAIFLLALQLPESIPIHWLSRLGRYGLGIYAVHLCIMNLILNVFEVDSVMTLILLACTTFALASGASIILGSSRLTSWLVR